MSIGDRPSWFGGTTSFVSSMRTRLGFSLEMSKDGFQDGGRTVRRMRNEGERDSANATGDGSS